MKRSFIILAVTLICICNAQAGKLERGIKKFVTDSTMLYSSTGIYIYDMKKNKEVADYRAEIADIPASTMKTVTCATALSLLGEEHTFDTDVKISGMVDNSGTLNGDIIIYGSGDPTLGSRYFESTQPNFINLIIANLKHKGINKIKGSIKIVPEFRRSEGIAINWSQDDCTYDYGAGAYQFNYSDNCFSLPINILNDTILIGNPSKNIPDFKAKAEVKFVDSNSGLGYNGTDLLHGLTSDELILCGVVNRGAGKDVFSCAITNPQKYFVSELSQALACKGIEYAKKCNVEPTDTVLLLTYKSPKLGEIVKSALYRSNNMFTECILREIGKAKYGIWSSDVSINLLKDYWESQGIDVNQLFMSDGSGLARNNKVTAKFLAQILVAAQNNLGNYSSYLPVFGVSGTVKSMLKDSQWKGQIAMKSGSMSRVQCYSGFFPVDNPRFTVTIMINNFLGSSKNLNNRINCMLEDILPVLYDKL